MNKEQIQELLLGVAVVVLGYAIYKHMKPGAAAPRPAAGRPPMPQTALDWLTSGTQTGLGSYYETTNNIINDVAGIDNSGNDSIVQPGAWWYGH